jgi:hypothetical protein
MENPIQEKKSVNYAFKMVGSLGHDNKLFDRTCPNCHNGMYSSRITSTCPKCGSDLVYITNSEGNPLTISEGTIYPAFGPKQEERDKAEISKRKNGMLITYRFKMFSFMNETGALMPPPEHDRCRKGSKVELLILNHQLIPSWFKTKEGTVKVELMAHVYTNYGDKIKVLTEQEYASKVVHHQVYPDGTVAPVEVDTTQKDARITALENQIAEMKAMMLKITDTPSPTDNNEPKTDCSVPPWGKQNAMEVSGGIDPFAGIR